ncbi:MAG: OmpH/Skp family outer membrane protein [Armatimonadota bacterium]
MFRHIRWGLLCALAIIMLAPLTGAFAAAAPAAPTNAIGIIDLDKVAAGFNGYKVAMERMRMFADVRKNYFDDLSAGVGLPAADFDKYKNLVNHAVRTDAEKKDIEALKAQAKQAMGDYEKLKANTTPADADKKRLEELEKDIKQASEYVDGERERLYGEMQGEYGKYSKILTDLVDKGIATVSTGKKLGIVISRDVQTKDGGKERFVLWGGTDITQDVIDSLNKTFKESMLNVAVDPTQPGGPAAGPTR